MIKILSKFLGLDYFFIQKNDIKVIYNITLIMIVIFIISSIGLIYGFNLAFEGLLISVLISLFIVLFIYNFYRLIFSIIEGELDHKSNLMDTYKFIIKRSLVLILLSVFISKSFQAYIFEGIVENKLIEYKQKLIFDYDKSLVEYF